MNQLCGDYYSRKYGCRCSIEKVSEDCFVVVFTAKTEDYRKISKITPSPYTYHEKFKTLEEAVQCIKNFDKDL